MPNLSEEGPCRLAKARLRPFAQIWDNRISEGFGQVSFRDFVGHHVQVIEASGAVITRTVILEHNCETPPWHKLYEQSERYVRSASGTNSDPAVWN